MNEKELSSRLSDAVESMQEAKRALDSAKRRLINAETNFIQCKLNVEKLTEDLRRAHDASPIQEPTRRDFEIARFREKYSDLCEEVRQRDKE